MGARRALKKAPGMLVLMLFLGLWIPSILQMSSFVTMMQGEGSKKFTDQSSRQIVTSGRYAFAFVIGGCRPEEPGYRGFLYDVWIAARMFQRVQSRADVVVFVQMSSKSPHARLPAREENVTEALGIRLIYLEENPHANFYEITLDKFRVVNMTDYDRVIFLDSDVMPLGNMDYIFELSMQGILEETFVLAGWHEPANGGFFMVTPRAGDWNQVQAIVFRREVQGAGIGYNKEKFDSVKGWGHTILPPDFWQSRKMEKESNWTFHAAYGMQGLLWYWVKYHKRNVSIRLGDVIENWEAGPNDTSRLVSTADKLFDRYSEPIIYDETACRKWMCDFAHFSGVSKPWQHEPPKHMAVVIREEPKDAYELWFHTLYHLNEEFSLGIDFEHWNVTKKPPLGGWPIFWQVGKKVVRSVERLRQAHYKARNETTV